MSDQRNNDEPTRIKGGGASRPRADDGTRLRSARPDSPAPEPPPSGSGAVPGTEPEPTSRHDTVFSPSTDSAGAGNAGGSIRPGDLLANTYVVERRLGAGGMGEVYLARHVSLGTEHAVKVIKDELLRNDMIMDLFHREAKVLRGLRHDAVVAYDGFIRDTHGRELLVMAFVAGESLGARFKRGPLSSEQVMLLRDRLVEGLSEAHARGAIHRDIAPDNVILPDGDVAHATLIDFGLSKLTDPAQGTILGEAFAGKYRYAAPEQVDASIGDISARSDIYSLGLTLAAAARGEPLDMGGSLDRVLSARRSVPALDGIDPRLQPMLRAMLQPDPARRPQTMAELCERWPAESTGTDRQDSKRSFLWVAKVASVLIAVLFTAAWTLYQVWVPSGEEESAHEPVAVVSAPTTPTTPALVDKAPADLPLGPPEQPPARPSRGEVIDRVGELLLADRLVDAFTLVQSLAAEGKAVPADDTLVLAKRLREAGQLDESFALLRLLARDGDAEAAFLLGEMYDPNHFDSARSPFSAPRARKAREWYGKALEGGVGEASARIRAISPVAADDAGSR